MASERLTAEQYRQLTGAAPAQPKAPKGQFALGRLPPGVMNKTEQRFLDEWIRPLELTGDILWWAFEGIKLRLAPKTFLTVDFAVMMGDGSIDLIDVKGNPAMVEEDARAKMKVAADRYPFRFNLAFPSRKRGWTIEPVGR